MISDLSFKIILTLLKGIPLNYPETGLRLKYDSGKSPFKERKN